MLPPLWCVEMWPRCAWNPGAYRPITFPHTHGHHRRSSTALVQTEPELLVLEQRPERADFPGIPAEQQGTARRTVRVRLADLPTGHLQKQEGPGLAVRGEQFSVVDYNQFLPRIGLGDGNTPVPASAGVAGPGSGGLRKPGGVSEWHLITTCRASGLAERSTCTGASARPVYGSAFRRFVRLVPYRRR